MKTFDDVIRICSELLHSAPAAEECRCYLSQRIKQETMQRFSFGYFPGVSQLNLLESSINKEILKSLSLLYTKEVYDSQGAHSFSFCFFEQHPLIMPYRDVYGHIIGIVGRSLLSDEERAEARIAKYKNTVFTKGSHVFNLFEAKEAILREGFVYVVEGQFDAIKAYERGLHNVVALGSADLSAYQLSLICRYSDDLRLLLDNDEAGMKGRERARGKYAHLAKVSDVFLPAGFKDLDDYLSSGHGMEEMSFVG